jgi:hypothetical protein
MGLFDFVKDAGRKLTGKKGEAIPDAATAEYIEETQKGNALWHHVTDLGLEVEDLQVAFDDGVATVTGTAASRDVAEKVVLAIGNAAGVAQVDDRWPTTTRCRRRCSTRLSPETASRRSRWPSTAMR